MRSKAWNPTTEAWEYIEDFTISGGTVDSVNGKTGAVLLTAADVQAIPATPGTAGQFAQSDGTGGIRFVTLPNLDTEAR